MSDKDPQHPAGERGRPRPKKSLGQNFLRDPNLIRKIVAAVDPLPGDFILEYGCGTGVLTRPLVASGARVLGVEVDRELIDRLAADPELAGLELRDEGLEKLPPLVVAETLGVSRIKLVGNLPYQFSSVALFGALEGFRCLERVVFMLQREVAERILETPGSRRFGILPALIQARFAVEKVLDAGPKAFSPSPEVKSRVIRLRPLDRPRVSEAEWPGYRDLVKTLFRERRKQLGTLLKKYYGLDDDYLVELCRSGNIEPERRPETLSIEELADLSARLPRGKA